MNSSRTPIKTYGYDAAGRTTSVTSSAGTTTLTYDFESRFTQISGPGINASYSYNGLDTRVGKTENSVSNTFRRSGAYVTDPVLSDGTASYTPGVSRRTGTETRYFHTGLKNTDSLTNPSQTVAAARIYDAFGNVTSSSGTWSGPFGYAGNFGYQQDASGLKLLGHRYYDPSTGRFLTRDPIKDGRNWYAYGAGEASPTNIADPTGLEIRDPNPKELEEINRAISYVEAVDPAKARALKKLLRQKRIKVEATVGHNRYLGRMDAGIMYVWSGILDKPVILSSVLVHELVHIEQNKQGRFRRGTSSRERQILEAEARQEQLEYLEKLQRQFPRLQSEAQREIDRVRRQASLGL